jgi:hypothetical protein
MRSAFSIAQISPQSIGTWPSQAACRSANRQLSQAAVRNGLSESRASFEMEIISKA